MKTSFSPSQLKEKLGPGNEATHTPVHLKLKTESFQAQNCTLALALATSP